MNLRICVPALEGVMLRGVNEFAAIGVGDDLLCEEVGIHEAVEDPANRLPAALLRLGRRDGWLVLRKEAHELLCAWGWAHELVLDGVLYGEDRRVGVAVAASLAIVLDTSTSLMASRTMPSRTVAEPCTKSSLHSGQTDTSASQGE